MQRDYGLGIHIVLEYVVDPCRGTGRGTGRGDGGALEVSANNQIPAAAHAWIGYQLLVYAGY